MMEFTLALENCFIFLWLKFVYFNLLPVNVNFNDCKFDDPLFVRDVMRYLWEFKCLWFMWIGSGKVGWNFCLVFIGVIRTNSWNFGGKHYSLFGININALMKFIAVTIGQILIFQHVLQFFSYNFRSIVGTLILKLINFLYNVYLLPAIGWLFKFSDILSLKLGIQQSKTTYFSFGADSLKLVQQLNLKLTFKCSLSLISGL